MKDIDGDKMYNLYVESMRADDMPHIDRDPPNRSAWQGTNVDDQDNEMATPDMFQGMVTALMKSINKYDIEGSVAFAMMLAKNFKETSKSMDYISRKLNKIGVDKEQIKAFRAEVLKRN